MNNPRTRNDFIIPLAIFVSLLVLIYWVVLIDKNVSSLILYQNTVRPTQTSTETKDEKQNINWTMMELSQSLHQITSQISKNHEELKTIISTKPTPEVVRADSSSSSSSSLSEPKTKSLKTNKGATFLFGIESRFSKWRAETLLTKEPGTIEWIDSTIQPNSVVWDVGANIGIYSIYALASSSSLKVVAFEPEALNYAEYYRNLYLNSFWDRVMVFPIAIGSTKNPRLIDLNINTFQAGNGYHSVVGNGKQKETVMLWSLDTINSSFQLPPPTHLKIDVENGEMEVLNGAAGVLKLNTLRHLLVEVKGEGPQEKVKSYLSQFGWTLKSIDIGENLFFVK